MPKKQRIKKDICHDCNIYHLSCAGEKFKRPPAPSAKGCVYQEKSPENTKSKIQLVAFTSLYKAKRKGGMDKLNSLVEAIVHTSDDAFANAVKKRNHLIKRYEDK